MKIPQLKGFDCVDHNPIDEWTPESDADVFYSLCLQIGFPDSGGADLFYVDVMTPQAINNHNLGRQLSQRRIIVNPYSWEAVIEAVRAILECCAGDDWSQQSALLAMHFSWEFENYRQ
jgi:hypothetical protein